MKTNEQKEEQIDIKRSELKWWQDTLVYEAYPSSFQDTDGDGYGDLQGVIQHLDHLESLGVGAIWLTPVFASPMKDNGYDVSNYYEINPRYGTMDDMDELIAKAKEHNIRIVMDMVFNHTSDESPWFQESKQDKTNPKSDWYIWADAVDGHEPNNWGGIFGGSAWTWCEERGQYYLHTFADFQPDVNWENPEVRAALFDVANYWVDKGVGGFRVDAVTYFKKPDDFGDGPINPVTGFAPVHDMTANTPGILDFLHEFKSKVQEGHDIFMVGEANGVPAEELTQWVGKDGVFDMIFEFSHVNVQFVNGGNWCNVKEWPLTDLKKAFADSQKATADNGWYPIFMENHDQPRKVAHFLPNCTDPVLGAKALAAIEMTMRGTPFLYEGEELGMTNMKRDSIDQYNDLSTKNQYKIAMENGMNEAEALECVSKLSRDNARTPMQWSDSENADFTTGTPWLAMNPNYPAINAAAQENDPDSVLNWYRKLNTLRQENNVLITGNFTMLMPDDEQIFAFTRETGDDKALIIVNLSEETADYDADLANGLQTLLSNYDKPEAGKLRPYEAVIWCSAQS